MGLQITLVEIEGRFRGSYRVLVPFAAVVRACEGLSATITKSGSTNMFVPRHGKGTPILLDVERGAILPRIVRTDTGEVLHTAEAEVHYEERDSLPGRLETVIAKAIGSKEVGDYITKLGLPRP